MGHHPDNLWPSASTLETAPNSEPVTRDEAKSHLRVDGTDEDALIDTLIVAARRYVEEQNRWALVTQTWDAFYDRFPKKDTAALVIPRPPLQSVTDVFYTDEDGTKNTLSSSEYNVDTDQWPGRVLLKRDNTWPDDELDTSNPVRVRFTAGYGDPEDVPKTIYQALLLLIGTMYEHRETTVTGTIVREMPFAAKALIEPYRAPALA